MKCYNTIEDLSRDYRAIYKTLPEHMQNYVKTGFWTEAAASSVNLRGAGANKPTPVSAQPPKPVNVKAISNLNTQIQDLSNKKRDIDNIVATLMHGFKGTDVGNIDNLRSNAMKTSKAIGKELDSLKSQLHTHSEKNASTELKEIVDKTYAFITKALKGNYAKASKTYLSADGMMSGFITLTNVSDDSKEVISPKDVFAITQNGLKYYFNASLNSVEMPGEFNLGIALDGNGVTSILTAIKRLFQSQRVADGHLSGIAKVNSPVEEINLVDKVDGVTKSYVKDGSVYVNFNQAVGKNQKLLQSAINDIQTHIAHIAYTEKARVRVVYSPPKNIARGVQVIFSFVPANKYSGVTVDNDETSYLNRKFPESEVREIKKLLTTIRSNPDNVVEKDYSKKPATSEGWIVRPVKYGIYLKLDGSDREVFASKIRNLSNKCANIFNTEVDDLKTAHNKSIGRKKGGVKLDSLRLTYKVSKAANEATIYLRTDKSIDSENPKSLAMPMPSDLQKAIVAQIKKLLKAS